MPPKLRSHDLESDAIDRSCMGQNSSSHDGTNGEKCNNFSLRGTRSRQPNWLGKKEVKIKKRSYSFLDGFLNYHIGTQESQLKSHMIY